MAYAPPTITSTGITIPTYQDILDDLVTTMKSIYGADIYLGEDTADYQLLSVFALRIHDCHLAAQDAYNNRSPKTSVGAGLSSIVKLNGIRRKTAAYSTCPVTLTGTAGAVVNNGVVRDVNGFKWDLPPVVSIGPGGTVTVTATCQTLGAVTALVGDLSIIGKPTFGWTGVTNGTAASPGLPVESDTKLRARQSASVALPSQTLLAGTAAAIASLPGVTRYKVYENDTNATDANGIPSHSVCAVVEGGVDADVAQVIYNNKGVGCGTHGGTTVTVTDPVTDFALDIEFSRPTSTPIYVTLNVHPLAGYTTATATAIKQAVADYMNSLQIGEDLLISSLYGAALSALDLTAPSFSIRALVAGTVIGLQTTNDIAIDFDAVTAGDTANIVIVEV